MAQKRTLNWPAFLLTEAGRTALDWETGAFAAFAAGKNGDRALQIGLWPLDALAKSPIGHRIAVSSQLQAMSGDDFRCPLVAETAALPLAGESCDIVVWPHGPDMEAGATGAALAEIVRVLAPNGLLVVSLFNPMGCWKLCELWRGPATILPAESGNYTLAAAKAMLVKAGLTLEGGRFGAYGTGARQGARLQPTWLDKAGDRWWPTLSNVFVISARKTDAGLRLVGKVAFGKSKRTKSVGALAHKESGR